MRVLQRFTDRRHDGQRLLRREPAGRHGLAQVHAIDKLHQQEVEAAGLAEVVNRDDVRVIQRGQRVGLAGEALRKSRIPGALGREQLERDEPIQRTLPRLVHHTHPAAA